MVSGYIYSSILSNFISSSKYFDKILLSQYISKNISLFLSKSVTFVILMIMICIFRVPEKMKYPSFFSLIAILFILFLLIILMCFMIKNEPEKKQTKQYESNLFQLFAVVIFVFENIPIYVPIRYTMKHPQKFLRVSISNFRL